MQYKTMLNFQKCLYFNVYITGNWILLMPLFLYAKFDMLGHLSKYLSLTVFALLSVIETIRLYFGHYGNLSCRVPELAVFLILTLLMQIPLVSFFLFNPYLFNSPTEITLHTMLLLLTFAEVIFGFLALRQASAVAKNIYLSNKRISQE